MEKIQKKIIPLSDLEKIFRHKVLTDRMFRKKSLDSPQTRIGFRWRVKTGRQLAETHRFCLAQSRHKQRNELDMDEVDIFFKEDAQRVG